MGGIEDASGAGLAVAYGAIVLFLLLLLTVVARTAMMYGLLLLLPIVRLLRWVPGMPALLARLEGRIERDESPRARR